VSKYFLSAMILAALCGSAGIELAFTCSPGAISQPLLEKQADIIATGTIFIIKQNERRTESESVVEGTAELRTNRSVKKNRTGLSAPFRFHFEYIESDGCVFGILPEAGRRARVYLKRGAGAGDLLKLLYLEEQES